MFTMNIGNNESLIITEAKVYKKSSAGTLHPGLCVIAGCNQWQKSPVIIFTVSNPQTGLASRDTINKNFPTKDIYFLQENPTQCPYLSRVKDSLKNNKHHIKLINSQGDQNAFYQDLEPLIKEAQMFEKYIQENKMIGLSLFCASTALHLLNLQKKQEIDFRLNEELYKQITEATIEEMVNKIFEAHEEKENEEQKRILYPNEPKEAFDEYQETTGELVEKTKNDLLQTQTKIQKLISAKAEKDVNYIEDLCRNNKKDQGPIIFVLEQDRVTQSIIDQLKTKEWSYTVIAGKRG